jgi:ribonuclease HI
MYNKAMSKIILYTDGSCSPNPGPGGFAVISDGQPVRLGHSVDSTNIRMEGEALIAAMEFANGAECEVFTDSEFWVNVITKWSLGWEANGWKKKSGEIKNLDLVKKTCALYKASNATLTWTRAHVGTDGNELADQWANQARIDSLEK